MLGMSEIILDADDCFGRNSSLHATNTVLTLLIRSITAIVPPDTVVIL